MTLFDRRLDPFWRALPAEFWDCYACKGEPAEYVVLANWRATPVCEEHLGAACYYVFMSENERSEVHVRKLSRAYGTNLPGLPTPETATELGQRIVRGQARREAIEEREMTPEVARIAAGHAQAQKDANERQRGHDCNY